MFDLREYLIEKDLKVVSISTNEDISILLDNKAELNSKNHPELLDYSFKALKEIAKEFEYKFEEKFRKIAEGAKELKYSMNSIFDKFLLDLEEVSSDSTLDEKLMELLEEIEEKRISAEIFEHLLTKDQKIKLESRKKNQEIYKDSLTGASNRAFFNRFLGEEGEFRRDEDVKSFNIFLENMIKEMQFDSIMCIDLNNFKFINDKVNHDTGDKVLKNLVKVLEDETRRIVIRSGGDEFTILGTHKDLEELSQKFYTQEFLTALNKDIPKINKEDGTPYIATASCGISTFKINEYSANSLEDIYKIKENIYQAYKEADMNAMEQKLTDKIQYDLGTYVREDGDSNSIRHQTS